MTREHELEREWCPCGGDHDYQSCPHVPPLEVAVTDFDRGPFRYVPLGDAADNIEAQAAWA